MRRSVLKARKKEHDNKRMYQKTGVSMADDEGETAEEEEAEDAEAEEEIEEQEVEEEE